MEAPQLIRHPAAPPVLAGTVDAGQVLGDKTMALWGRLLAEGGGALAAAGERVTITLPAAPVQA